MKEEGRKSQSFSRTSAARAPSSSLRFARSSFGYWSVRSVKASTTVAATTSRVNYLWSAGTTCHGASGVAVC